MTATQQDFTTYAGDGALPIFTVVDGNGNPIDISSVASIIWNAQRDLDAAAPVVTKSYPGSGIAFVTDGTNGQFQVTLTGSDTSALSGYYIHQAQIVDGFGEQSTVTIGRMRVGRAPIWTYSGDPTNSTTDQIRFLIGDTKESDPLLSDGEIKWALAQRSSIYGAAAFCCRSLATRFAREVDNVVNEMHLLYSQRMKAFRAMALDYEGQSSMRGGALPFAGGISISEKVQNANNPDLVEPAFQIGMDTNYIIPFGPAGNESPYGAGGEGGGE